VGGKSRLLPHIVPLAAGADRVVEPFFGGGAVSFALAAENPTVDVVASDALAPLMDIYRAVRSSPDEFISAVEAFASPYLAAGSKAARRAEYYRVREEYLHGRVDGPAPLFFMLWCAYSGLYRTGKTFPGRFNTSHGFGAEKPGFYRPDRLRSVAPLLDAWVLLDGDFSDTLRFVGPATFVFLDPPYRETYGGYTSDGFNDVDQERVVSYFWEAAERGARVAYTNKDVGDGFYDDRFPGCDISRIPIRYQVNRNCSTVGRPQTHEVLIVSPA
jgi:DNA adenine methylase